MAYPYTYNPGQPPYSSTSAASLASGAASAGQQAYGQAAQAGQPSAYQSAAHVASAAAPYGQTYQTSQPAPAYGTVAGTYSAGRSSPLQPYSTAGTSFSPSAYGGAAASGGFSAAPPYASVAGRGGQPALYSTPNVSAAPASQQAAYSSATPLYSSVSAPSLSNYSSTYSTPTYGQTTGLGAEPPSYGTVSGMGRGAGAMAGGRGAGAGLGGAGRGAGAPVVGMGRGAGAYGAPYAPPASSSRVSGHYEPPGFSSSSSPTSQYGQTQPSYLQQQQQQQEQQRKHQEQQNQRQSEVKMQVQQQMNAIREKVRQEEEEKKRLAQQQQAEEQRKRDQERMEREIEERVKREEERIRREYEQRLASESEQRQRAFEEQMRQREMSERASREQEQQVQKAQFEQQWREREAQWKQEEAARKAKEEQERLVREEKERIMHKVRLEEEQRMIREARAQAKLKATEEMQAAMEQRKQQEMVERQQRETALVGLLERERAERAAREQEMLQLQQQREQHMREQEQARLDAALARFRAEESARIKEETTAQFRQEEENRIRQQLEQDFERQAEERQKVYANERRHIEQATAMDRQATWIVDPSTVEVGSLIGQGAFGSVFRGKMSGKEVAIKKLNVQSVDADTLEEFQQEISIMSNLRHPNVLLFIGACTQPGNLFIVSELMQMGSLQDVLFKNQVSLSFKRRLQILKEIALGMRWLHGLKPPFLHRDLKSGNVLLDENFNVKISDFGFLSVKSLDEAGEHIAGPVGSPFYMAPEVLLDKPADTKADVYSFSIVMWETLTNEDPYQDLFDSYEEMVESITLDDVRPDIPQWLSPPIARLVQECWSNDPAARPSFGHMLDASLFDHFIVDAVLADPQAAAFWKQHFLERDTVLWEEFLGAVNAFCGVQLQVGQPAANLLKWLVVSKAATGIENVTIEAFGENLASWFAPFASPRALLDNVLALASSGWYHGAVTAPQAEPFLRTLPHGSWLVRHGQLQEEGKLRQFFVSVHTPQGVVHAPFTQPSAGGPLRYCPAPGQPALEFNGWQEAVTSSHMAQAGVVPANCARMSPLSAILSS